MTLRVYSIAQSRCACLMKTSYYWIFRCLISFQIFVSISLISIILYNLLVQNGLLVLSAFTSPMLFLKFKTNLSCSIHQVIFPPLLKISSIVTFFKKPNLKNMTQNHSLQCYWQMISQRKSPKENDGKGKSTHVWWEHFSCVSSPC